MRAHEARIQQKQAWFEQLKVGQGPVHQGELLARAGRWAEAAAALAKGIANAPQDVGLQHHRFLCIVWAGDREAYARLAVEALARYGPEATFVSSGVAWACSLAPDVVAEHNVPVRVAEAALENVSDDWKNFSTTCLGAALFRAGRYDEAIRLLNESGEADGGPGVPQVWAFLAMAHHRKGDAAEARRWLDKLLSYRPGASASFFWDDVEVQLLRREAESVVLGGAPAHP